MTMLELVKDEELFGQLITCLECRNDERLKSLLSDKFSDVTSLANSFSSWLDDQINSYLIVDASSRSSTNTNSKNCTNSIDNAVSQARVSKGINNSALESRLHDQRSIANESTANKNDSTVSQDKVTNTPEEANGHCCNNNFPLTLGGYPIQVKIKKKKRLKANLVSQPSNKIFEGNISTLPDTDDLFESKASRTAKEVRIDPARRLASLDTRAAVASTEIEVGMKSVNEGSSAAIHKVDTLTISESSRTAQLLLILLHLHYISLAKYLEVLAKLINCAKILLDDQASFEVNTVFSNSSIRQFVVALLTLDIGVLKSLGRFVVQEISQSLIVQKQLPQILEQLNSFLDDIDQVDAPSIMPEILPETFLKPFNDQFDNRSDYKNQREIVLYNERERIFDSFSNVFTSFQQTESVTLFYNTTLVGSGSSILSMKPENMSWFADTFLNMLLFYGCSDRRTVKMAIDGQNGTDSSSVLQQKNFLVDSSAKKTFLEDRMRDTRNFPSGNNARIHSASKAYGSYSSPDLHVPYQQLSTEFEGNENFFFHFVVLLNNFHFNYCLTNVILREIFATSNRVEYAAKEFTARSEGNAELTTSSTSLDQQLASAAHVIDKVKKLRLLGKFLALVKHYPELVLNNPTTDDSSSKHGTLNLAFKADTIILQDSLTNAWLNGTLTTTIPWTVSYLKMMKAGISSVSSCFNKVLDLLYSVKFSKLFSVSELTGNRLFVLFEVESLFQSVTGGDSNRKGVLLPIYSKASRSLDAMNHGTVAEFIHHLMPNMYTSYRLMNADRTLIQTAIQSNRATRGFTSTVKNSKGKIVRRVTPETRLSIGVNEYERLSRGKQSSVQQSKVIELTDQKLEPLAVPVIIERQEVDSENISVDSLSSSLASSKVSMLLPQRKTNSTGKGSKGKENPRPSRQSPLKVHKERSNSILSSISITMKSPKYTFTPIANRGTPTKSLQAYASTDLFDTVGQSADAKADVLTRLESSFWIQHPELHQVCRFLLSHMYQSCLSHSKDRTAVPVRELLNALDSLQLTVKQRSSTNMNRPECISLLSNNLDYESESLKALNRIYNLYCEDGEKFIRNFYKTFQLKILPLLMKQFHAHKRVIKLVLSSINQIIASHIQQLVDLLRSYSYRKLHEAVGVKDRLFKTVKQSDISSSTCSITNNLVLSQQNAADEFTDREATQMLLPIKQSLCLLDNYYSFIALTTCKSSANSVDTVSASQLGSCKLEMVVRTQSLSQNSCNAVAHVCQVITHVYTILCQVCCRNRLSCGRYSDFKNFAAFKQDFDLVVFLENCEQLLKVITLATTAEQRGHLVKEKVTIELVKFFTKAFPLLLYLDEALAADLSENFSEINSSNITSAVEEQQLVSPNRVGFAASDMLSRFVEDQLLKFPVALRIVQLLVRSKVAQFYDNCKQIKFFSSIYGTLIKASVKRLVLNLFERYKTSEGSKANSSGAATTGNRSYLTSIPVSGGLDSPSAAPSLARSLFSDDDDSLLRDSPCTPQQFSNRYDNANSSSINAKAAGHAIEDTVLSVISERSTDWHQDRYLRAFISNNFGESVVSTIDTIVRDADTKLS